MKRYDAYKDSGIEWIGEIPAHWEVKRLKYVADSNPSNIDKKSNEGEENVLLCNYVDVYKNEFITSELDFMKATASRSQIEKFILQKGDVIATKDSETPNDIAIPALVIEDFQNVVCGYHLNHIKPNKINGSYLFRLFQSPYLKAYFEVAANGVTRYGIGAEKFSNVEILLPLPDEQHAIAAYLDRKTAEIDALIADKKRLLELYEEEKTALINQAVTKGITPGVPMKDSGVEWLGEVPEHWEVSRIKFIFSYFKGFAFKSSDFENNGIPIIKASNIKRWQIVDITSFIAEDNQRDEFEKVRLAKGDIILSTVGSKPDVINSVVGQLASVSEEFHSSYLNQNTLCLRPNERVNALFFKYSILSKYFRANLDSISAWIANQAYLEVEDILSIQIVIPPLEEQLKISNHIESENARIDAKKTKTEKLIELLVEYRAALISEVVTGNVRIVGL